MYATSPVVEFPVCPGFGAGRKMLVGMYGSACATAVAERQAQAISIVEKRVAAALCNSFESDPTASPTGGDKDTIPRGDFIASPQP
jgi:hypothetical protein